MSDSPLQALGYAIKALGEQLDTHLYFLAITVDLLEKRIPGIQHDLLDDLDGMSQHLSSTENEARLRAVGRLREILEQPKPRIFH